MIAHMLFTDRWWELILAVADIGLYHAIRCCPVSPTRKDDD